MKETIYDLGNVVICDICNNDCTNSKEKGGIIFGSKGVCPTCAKRMIPDIKKYHEENYIRATCPENKTFADFVREYRGGNNKVTVIEI